MRNRKVVNKSWYLSDMFAIGGGTIPPPIGKDIQDFFALWKDADPDIPILKEAKAEYAKLQ